MEANRHLEKSQALDQHLTKSIVELRNPFEPEKKPMSGSFAAQIKAMMDEARAGVEQAKAEGLAKVGDAVGKLNDAKVAATKVAGSMAKTIEEEANAVLAELGQISNDL